MKLFSIKTWKKIFSLLWESCTILIEKKNERAVLSLKVQVKTVCFKSFEADDCQAMKFSKKLRKFMIFLLDKSQ